MLRTIAAAGAIVGCAATHILVLSSSPAASLTISRCTLSSDLTLDCKSCAISGERSDAASAPPPNTLASLLTERYVPAVGVPSGVWVHDGRIILRKLYSFTPTYICNIGPIGSPTQEAFDTCKYDQVPCSLAPDRYP
jgi:hypothetical protein